MRTHFVLLALGKELRETLRDRRTLTVMILVPLVLYPVLGLMLTQIAAKRKGTLDAKAFTVAVTGQGTAADELRARIDKLPKQFTRLPAGTQADVDTGRLDALVALKPPTAAGRVPAEILLDATRDEGRRAEHRLSEEMEAMWPNGCAPRFEVTRSDIAPKARFGGYILSQALPIMILVMVVLGAFYPAIDVTAGERERGTLETVLVAPIPRRDLLLGKVLAVTLLASASGLINLGSMTLTMIQGFNIAAPDADLPVPFARAAATGLVILPTAFLLAGVFVAIGSLARGFKEAQNLLAPVYFAFFAPAILGSVGNLTLGPGLAVVPGLNVSLLARDIALGKADVAITVLVLGSTLAWGLLALAGAARLYVSERFLAVGDDAQPKKKRGFALYRTDPPNATEAMSIFAVGFILLYFVFIPLQRKELIIGMVISQWAGFAGLAVLFALQTRRKLSAALGIASPQRAAWLGALLVGLGGWMVANVITQWVAPAPKEFIESFRKLLFPEDNPRSLATNLFLFALTPALCEEIFFRGVIMRGLLTKMSPAGAIGLSAAMFAIFHIDVYRLLPTGLLGVLLGFVAWRAGTFLASALVHFLNNGILVVLGTFEVDRRLDALGNGAELGLFAGAVVLVGAGLAILLRTPPDPGSPPVPRM